MTVLWMSRNPGERHAGVDFFRLAARVDGGPHATLRSRKSRRVVSTYNHYRCVLQKHYAEADAHTEHIDVDQERSRRHAR
jgi:predicted SprT family Zn-dependent metalloprotease